MDNYKTFLGKCVRYSQTICVIFETITLQLIECAESIEQIVRKECDDAIKVGAFWERRLKSIQGEVNKFVSKTSMIDSSITVFEKMRDTVDI